MKTKYIGVVLIFSCKKGKTLEGRLRYFLMNLIELTNIKRTAEKIGHKCEVAYKDCTYLGINDIFEVNGPIKTGAIMGRTTLWSYKDIASAKKLIRPTKHFSIYKYNPYTVDNSYIAEMVFFLQFPSKYDLRRTLVCNVLLKSQSKKRVVKDAVALGQSKQLLKKIKDVLLQYEAHIPGELAFIGLTDIYTIPERVKVGNSFRTLCKNFNKRSAIVKLAMIDKAISAKIKAFSRHYRK